MDRRIKKTRSAIKHAMITLMGKYSQEEITVSMIALEADINRTTFYDHFNDKEEFMAELIYDTLKELKDAILTPFLTEETIHIHQVTPTTEHIFKHIEENRRLFSVLSGNKHFKEQMEALFYHIFTEEIFIETNSPLGKVNYELFIHYQTSATVGLIFYWIKHNFEQPAEYMMKQLTVLSNMKVVNLRKR
ncbi:TetR/AcrR family transcriptional regulator [Virgibacillus kimchii]